MKFRFGGLTLNLSPWESDGLRGFVAPVDLIATRYNSTPCVKYSSSYSGSNFNLFPVAQPEPETEMPKIMVYSREVNKFYIVYKFHRYRMPIDGARRYHSFRRIPPVRIFRQNCRNCQLWSEKRLTSDEFISNTGISVLPVEIWQAKHSKILRY